MDISAFSLLKDNSDYRYFMKYVSRGFRCISKPLIERIMDINNSLLEI